MIENVFLGIVWLRMNHQPFIVGLYNIRALTFCSIEHYCLLNVHLNQFSENALSIIFRRLVGLPVAFGILRSPAGMTLAAQNVSTNFSITFIFSAAIRLGLSLCGL